MVAKKFLPKNRLACMKALYCCINHDCLEKSSTWFNLHNISVFPGTYGCDGGDDCCSDELQCDIGEGDCDQDSHCKGDLVCGDNNCQTNSLNFGLPTESFDYDDDCCESKYPKSKKLIIRDFQMVFVTNKYL